MKVSVITTSFNQGGFLEQAIRSVINQGYPDLEYIIIDGGSTDNSMQIISRYSAYLKYWTNEKDDGQSCAFNKGLRASSGDVIGWLNSDDLYLGGCIFQAAEYLAKHSSIDIVFSDYYYIDENSRILRYRREIPFNYNVYLWTADCYHANCAGFFRRSVFNALGGLDEGLQYGMDYELYLRAAQSGMRFGHVRRYWGAYRLHGQSKSVARHSLQRDEGKDIAVRFYPSNTSQCGIYCRRIFFKFFRISWKFIAGSYISYIPAKFASRWRFKFRYDTQVKRKTCLALLKAFRPSWPGARIFELGFGSGETLFSFPRDCTLYGAEISDTAIGEAVVNAARKGYVNFKFFKPQANKPLPIADNFIDFAIASHVLEHIPDDAQYVGQLYRILKTGGRLAVLVPINERFADPNHVRKYTIDSCRKLCEDCGFSFVYGFENELLFYLVERLYYSRRQKGWDFCGNLLRLAFNVLTSRLPFRAYRLSDTVVAKMTNLAPRQAALLFVKEEKGNET